MEKEYFHFAGCLHATADDRLNNSTIKELWRGFCFDLGSLELSRGDELSFTVGGEMCPSLPKGSEFAVIITPKGIAASGKNYGALVRALMVVMMRIEPADDGVGLRIECGEMESRYSVETRMIHFCIFPETGRTFIKKCIRLAGVMQYTHVVLEFWGMLQFDCLGELSWGNAFSKEEARALVREIEELGMEPIPMFNHLGHASACRVSGGKHVVLDQNPRLAALFAPDGWAWNIESVPARSLLRHVRRELYELFPTSQYIHLGCDEVYSYESGDEDQRRMREFLSDILNEVIEEGRRPIIWGDMLLNAESCGVSAPYFTGCDTPENAEKLLAVIPKETVIADWHYDVTETPVKTSVYLRDQGFDVLGAPWYKRENCRAYVETVCRNNLMGIMVTTWHTLAEKMPHIVTDAALCGAYQSPWSGLQDSKIRTETAALLRKVCFAAGDYTEAGWTDCQLFKQANAMT